jgi:hypothetical protein
MKDKNGEGMLRRPMAAFSVPVNVSIFNAVGAERVVSGDQLLRHSGHHALA